VELWGAASDKPLLPLRGSDGFSGIRFSPDGKVLLGFAPQRRQWRAWNAEMGKATHTGAVPAEWSKGSIQFAASPDGKTAAISGQRGREAFVALFDVQTGKQTRRLNAPGGQINCLAFSRDGQVLAAGTRDGRICLWDVGKGPRPGE